MSNDRDAQRVALNRLGATIFGYVYVYWWAKRANWRHRIEKGAIGLLILFLVVLLLELGLEIFGFEMARSRSIATQLVFILAFSVALYSKLREWGARRQELFFLQAAKKTAELLGADREHLVNDGTIEKLLGIFHATFRRKGPISTTLALRTEDDRLEIRHWYPPSGRTHDVTFHPNEGGAGYSYANRCIVYIPRTHLGHAIIQTLGDDDPYEMVGGLYIRGDANTAYRSILSVPVVIFGQCYGTLNFDSARPNAFKRIDFQQAMVYGSIVAQLLRMRREGEVGSR